MIYKTAYGTSVIHYSVTRTHRKSLAIEVHPDLSVHVVAPQHAAPSAIQEKILKRAQWIKKQQYYFDQFLPRAPKREYVAGETHHYLGKRYVLRIKKAPTSSVKLQGGTIVVATPYPDNSKHVKQALLAWYHVRAQRRFEESMTKVLPFFNNFKIERPLLVIKTMQRRWGSCTPGGQIILNPEIIKAPAKCIDYVVIHELCHLVHLNHSQAFYNLQTSIMPGWERWKLRLEKNLS